MKKETDTFSDTYVILEKLGEGSAGIVYKAYHKRLKKEVVLKELRGKSIDMQANRQEADILKNLNHMYLPQVLDFWARDGKIYTVMSYIPGRSFKELLDEGYQFTRHQLTRWGMQLCSALNYLHSRKPAVIHGDIKPSNLMLTPEGNLCLIDFNISFFMDDSTVLGYTDGYTSPEQYIIALDPESARSLPQYSSVDEKSDIYSVGATFYHLATGRKVRSYKEPVDFTALAQRMGEAFAQVIERAMRIDPEERFGSAFEMFQAFRGVTHKDDRYQALLRRQRAVRIGLAALMAGFIVLGGYGVHTLRQEKVQAYNRMVEDQAQACKERDFEKEEALYQKAVKAYPAGLESYYQHAFALYRQKEYAACVAFVDYDILENEKADRTGSRMADVYALKADSHFALGEYQKAVDAYEQMQRYGGYTGENYRDYAVALAYNGSAARAQEVLEEAKEQGLADDSVCYVKGEIEKSMRRMDQAEQEFSQCIRITKDDGLKARAYVMLGEIYGGQNETLKEREILAEARSVLPAEHQMLVLERLAQADIDLAEDLGQTAYREEAIEVLNEVVSQGWDTYDTYDNLVILNEKQGHLDTAYQILEEMKETYGEDYNIYKRYAFLEVDRQELKQNPARDYTAFASYYEKAVQMYYEELKGNETDAEMGLLENVYRQVESGGWL